MINFLWRHNLYLKYLYFKKPWSSQFSWYHQNSNHLYYTNPQKLKRIYVCFQDFCVFLCLYNNNDWFLVKKMRISAELKVCHAIQIFFLIYPPPPPHPRTAPKGPILNWDKLTKSLDFSKEKGNLVRLLFLQLKVGRNYNFVYSLNRSNHL